MVVPALEEPVEKHQLTPAQQSARAVMNFRSLHGYAAGEHSRQAAPCEHQMIITQGCKLEASGLNPDGSWLELTKVSHGRHIDHSAFPVSESHGCSLGNSKYLNIIFNLHY